jgi:hypothetical protein
MKVQILFKFNSVNKTITTVIEIKRDNAVAWENWDVREYEMDNMDEMKGWIEGVRSTLDMTKTSYKEIIRFE